MKERVDPIISARERERQRSKSWKSFQSVEEFAIAYDEQAGEERRIRGEITVAKGKLALRESG